MTGHSGHWAARYAAPVVVVLVLVVAGREWWLRRVRARHLAGARLLVVRPPAAPPAAGGLVAWRTLAGLASPVWKRLLFGQPYLVWEYRFDTEGLRVGVWVAGTVPPGLVEHAITAAWPGATVHPAAPDETPPLPEPASAGRVAAAGGALGLAQPEWYPIQTRHDVDPLRPLLEVGAGLDPDQTVCVQILTRPAWPRRTRRLRRAAPALRNGTPHRDPVAGTLAAAVDTTLDVLTPGPAATGRTRAAGRRAADPYLAEDLRAVRDKTAHPLWQTTIRYATTITTAAVGAGPAAGRARARGVADAVAGAFGTYAGRNQLTRHRLRHPVRVLAGRRPGRGFLASTPELAALAHLPYDPDAPGVDRAGARTAAPSPHIPTTGQPGAAEGRGVKVLGVAAGGHQRPVGLQVADARHHLHVLGATGSGKSTLLARLVLQDAAAGRGVLVIDPKGDLVTDLLDRLPTAAADRVVLFDPDDPHLPPPRINVLDGASPDLLADQVVGIFARIYAAWWGPRTDDILRAAVLTLTHPANRTQTDLAHLGTIPDLLTTPALRRRLTASLHTNPADRTLAGFWTWYDNLSDAARSQVTGPVLNKLRGFLLRAFVRDTVAAGASTVNMRTVLDGGICLARLPKGSLGEDTTRLLGSFLLARAWQAAAARAHTGAARPDCTIVLDEAHNFLTLPHSLEDMLAEARSFHLSLTLAHQNLAQLPRDLREGISTNARNKIYFQTSPEDATTLERHTTPTLTAHDLAHLDGYTAATRLLLNSHPTPAFTLRTRPLPDPTPGRAHLIRRTAATHQQPPTHRHTA